MNAIAFSLWGSDPKYTIGALENAKLITKVYPGWQMHVWLERESVPADTVKALTDWGVTLHDKDPDIPAWMFQRFLIHDVPEVQRYLIRDCDSRLSMRERFCVEEWISEGTLLHTIHDHPYHFKGPVILGGLWGLWREGDPKPFSMKILMRDSPWSKNQNWGADQSFLEAVFWPLYKHSCTQHGKTLSIQVTNRTDPQSFCGEIIDANGQPNASHRAMRQASAMGK